MVKLRRVSSLRYRKLASNLKDRGCCRVSYKKAARCLLLLDTTSRETKLALVTKLPSSLPVTLIIVENLPTIKRVIVTPAVYPRSVVELKDGDIGFSLNSKTGRHA